MANHPNRSCKSAHPGPTPAQIIAARNSVGLTQTQAASLLYRGLRNWQQWESGDRAMDPALWDLFRIRAGIE